MKGTGPLRVCFTNLINYEATGYYSVVVAGRICRPTCVNRRLPPSSCRCQLSLAKGPDFPYVISQLESTSIRRTVSKKIFNKIIPYDIVRICIPTAVYLEVRVLLRPAVGEVVWRRDHDPVEQLSAAQTQVSMGFEPLQEAVQFSPTPFSRKLSTDSHTLVVSGLFSCRCQVVEKKSAQWCVCRYHYVS